jgi:hypothetical protein
MKHKDLAKEAGFHISSSNFDDIGWVWCSDGYPIDEELERFAELVRQDEREACAKLCDLFAKSSANVPSRYEFMGESAQELAKPEQEPVAWMYKGNFHDFDPSEWASPEFVVTPLYTAPPKREWNGLTEDDMHTIRGDAFNKNVEDMNWAVMMARKINFILRGRNT